MFFFFLLQHSFDVLIEYGLPREAYVSYVVVKDYLDEVLEFGEHLWRALAMKFSVDYLLVYRVPFEFDEVVPFGQRDPRAADCLKQHQLPASVSEQYPNMI